MSAREMRKILVLNGPNLNMLGRREREVYGDGTLAELDQLVTEHGARRGVAVTCYQSNSESELMGIIHAAADAYDGIVFNPGAYTHYSYALRDAIACVETPVVEVHLSDIDNREPFRRNSVIAPVCVAQVKGLGAEGYCVALDLLCDGASGALADAAGEGARGFDGLGVREGSDGLQDSEGSEVPEGPDGLQGSEDLGISGDLEGLDGSRGAEGLRGIEGLHGSQGLEDASSAPVTAIDVAQVSNTRAHLLREACGQQGLRGMLVRDTSNIRWITAIDGVFDEERAHALLITDDALQLHTDSRYSNALRTAVERAGSALQVNDERKTHAQFAYDVLAAYDAHAAWIASICGDSTPQAEGEQSSQVQPACDAPAAQEANDSVTALLGIEDTITYAEYLKMQERFTARALKPTTDLVLALRAVKDAGEIARLKAAQAITDAAFAHIVKFMRPGMTERDVQLELEDFMVRHGAQGLAFGSIVATGPNGADPHAIPGKTRLQAGQCVVMDFGAKAFGYCSDMTRTVFLGEPEGLMLKAWETLRLANESVEAALKPGMTGAQAHQIAERVLEEGGFGGKMGHGLGHGVGIDVHEQPVLNLRNEAPLVEGNVVTVEPGIYLPGEFGMRLEDCGVLTATGYEPFTQTPHDLFVI